jgi:hypothetical protein
MRRVTKGLERYFLPRLLSKSPTLVDIKKDLPHLSPLNNLNHPFVTSGLDLEEGFNDTQSTKFLRGTLEFPINFVEIVSFIIFIPWEVRASLFNHCAKSSRGDPTRRVANMCSS